MTITLTPTRDPEPGDSTADIAAKGWMVELPRRNPATLPTLEDAARYMVKVMSEA